MVILSANQLEVAFGIKVIFQRVNFEVQENEKIGLIGINGSGKTTLFHLLSGKLEPTAGQIARSAQLRIGTMEQFVIADAEASVFDGALAVFEPLMEMEKRLEEIHQTIDRHGDGVEAALLQQQMELQERFERDGGLTYVSRTKAALLGLGFTESDMQKPIHVLSGGEKSKVQLARLLLSDANLLLLDEPTNHLDIAACEWLEKFLSEYAKAFIVVSHDRYFLDKVTAKTMEIENCSLKTYIGNYTEFMHKKEEARKAAQKKYELTMKEINRIEGIIEQQKRWNQAANYVTIASKQKSIDRLRETLEKPETSPQKLRFNFQCKESIANDVLTVQNLSLTLGEKRLFANVNMEIKKAERVFLLGANGSGKTSIFKCLTHQYQPDSGEIVFGAKISVGFYDQLHAGLHPEKTAIDELWDTFPKMTQTEIRTALGQFLFKDDDVYKPISVLSGGEKARVSLLMLMLEGANLLLLDEPTNHLDMASREALENALLQYPGTLFIISHDRYLINRLSTKIYELSACGVTAYSGNYDYYLLRKSGTEETGKPVEKPKKGNEYRMQKERLAEQRKMESKLTRIEQELDSLEQRMEEINTALQDEKIAVDYEKTLSYTMQLSELSAEMDKKLLEWEETDNALQKLG